MQFSDDLYQLIKSLTKPEKRYFKMQAALQKGEKDYLVLFEEFEALAAAQRKDGENNGHNEASLKAGLKGKIKVNQLHVMKNYLMGLLLKSLRTLREKTNVEDQLAVLLSEARMLEQRGLYDICTKRLDTAKAICLKYEKYSTAIELLELERRLCARTSANMVEEKIGKIRANIDRYLYLLNNTLVYDDLRHRVLAIYRQENRARSEYARHQVAEILDNELLHDDNMPATFQAKISFYHIWSLLAYLQGDMKAANHYYKKIQDVWTGYPHFKEEYPSTYVIYSSNYLVSCHQLRDYAPFPALLDELKTIPTGSLYEEAEAFQNISFLEQLYFMNKGIFGQMGINTGKAKTLATAIAAGLNRYGSKIVKSRELSFIHNTAIMFFALSDYNDALHWLVKVQQLAKTDQRKDIQLLARLLQLIIFLEKGEHLYIDNAFKAFEYHLKKEDKHQDFEGMVTSFLKRIAGQQVGQRKLFETFRDELRQFEPQMILGYEEISIWVDSKLQNKSFLEVMKDRFDKLKAEREK